MLSREATIAPLLQISIRGALPLRTLGVAPEAREQMHAGGMQAIFILSGSSSREAVGHGLPPTVLPAPSLTQAPRAPERTDQRDQIADRRDTVLDVVRHGWIMTHKVNRYLTKYETKRVMTPANDVRAQNEQ